MIPTGSFKERECSWRYLTDYVKQIVRFLPILMLLSISKLIDYGLYCLRLGRP